MRISDWSSDVCSSDLIARPVSTGEADAERPLLVAEHGVESVFRRRRQRTLTPRLAVFTAQSPFGVGLGVVEIDQEPVVRRGQEGQRLLKAAFDTLDLGAVSIDRNVGLVIRDPFEK